VRKLRLWIGHYLGLPEEWFLVWAPDKTEALVMVDGTVAEPDPRSMRELKGMGMIDLKMVKEENPDSSEDSPEYLYYLGQIGDSEVDASRQAEGMRYDNMVEIDDEVGEWIKKCVETPFKPPMTRETSSIAKSLGIYRPEVLRAYLRGMKGTCPSCGEEMIYGNKCKNCGFSFKLER
jgi:hypothetical protein